MRYPVASLFVVLSGFGNLAQAQQTVTGTSAPAPSPIAAVVSPTSAVPPNPNAPDASGRYMLRDGTDVNLLFAQDLSSKTASEGDPVTLTSSMT
jgi:hypothetical protein